MESYYHNVVISWIFSFALTCWVLNQFPLLCLIICHWVCTQALPSLILRNTTLLLVVYNTCPSLVLTSLMWLVNCLGSCITHQPSIGFLSNVSYASYVVSWMMVFFSIVILHFLFVPSLMLIRLVRRMIVPPPVHILFILVVTLSPRAKRNNILFLFLLRKPSITLLLLQLLNLIGCIIC